MMKIKDDVIKSEAYIIEKYLDKYGNIDLDTLIQEVQGNHIYECPVCKGKGEMLFSEYNSWLYKTVYWYGTCGLCEGYGYTEEEKKPKMKQVGWE